MMQDLISTIQKLKTDKYAAITVLNTENATVKIEHEATGDFLANKYNSVENFFEEQFKAGITSLLIVPRRKNGSSYKSDGKSFIISMTPKEQAAPNPVAAVNVPSFGLMGGLNQMDLSYKFMDHPRLVSLVASLEAENKSLKEQNDNLKEKDIRNEFESKSKSANAELFKTLAPLLAPVISKLAAPDAPGLTGGNLRPLQQQFLTFIQSADDATLTYLISVTQGFPNNEFLDELEVLLKKHKITE